VSSLVPLLNLCFACLFVSLAAGHALWSGFDGCCDPANIFMIVVAMVAIIWKYLKI